MPVLDQLVNVKLRQLGWIIGLTTDGLLGINAHRRLYILRDGRVELEDTHDTDHAVIRPPHTVDLTWSASMSLLGVRREGLRYEPLTCRWSPSPSEGMCRF